MGRTTKRRSVSNSSAAAGDTENGGTPSARRSARKTKVVSLAVEEENPVLPGEEEGCAGAKNGEEKAVEGRGSTPNGEDQPNENGGGDSEVKDARREEKDDGEAVPEKEINAAVSRTEQTSSSPSKEDPDSNNSDATAGQDAAVSLGAPNSSTRAEEPLGGGSVSPARATPRVGRPSPRSRSVDKDGPVRRSRRLSRGSSVEPSDDEGVNPSVSVSAQAVADKLHTIVEASETPEKKHPVAAVKESPPPLSALPSSQMEVIINSAGAGDGVVKASKPVEDDEEDMPPDTIKLTVESSEILDKFDDSDEEEKDAVAAPVVESLKKEGTDTAKPQPKIDTTKESAVSKRRNRSTSSSRSPPRKRGRGSRRHSSSSSESRSRSDDRQRRRRRPSDVDKDTSSARGSAKKKPSQRDSIAGDDRRRLSRSRSPPHSSSKLSSKSSQKERSLKRSTPVTSKINASDKNSGGGGGAGGRHSSSSAMKSPSSSKKGRLSPPHSPSSDRRRYNKTSPSTEMRKKKSPDHVKRKHSPIILKGLADEQHSPTKMPRVNSTDNDVAKVDTSDTKEAEDKENKEQVDDFDYASFKSSRRVSLSTKLRDPTKDGHRKAALSKLSGVMGKKEEPTIEISSQSLRTIIPDVQPLSESELKLDDSDEEVEAGRPGKDDEDSAGSLSDGELKELRKKQMLLQKKLKGLEEKDEASSAGEEGGKEAAPKAPGSRSKKRKALESNGYGGEAGQENEDEFSDAEEEEKALRRAAQQSMKEKIAKKEELKRRLSKEDEKPDKKKTKKIRDGSLVQKKVRDDGSGAPRAGARAIEGPVVVVRKGPSIAPARNPTSCVVIIKNLTRPFTLRQLQALLQRTGRIVQGGFWVDSIKSVCIARFETEDQAEETRMHLHGIQWPGSNPKTLFVDFTTEAELERRMEECGSSLPPAQEQPRRKAAGAAAVREWDRVKLGERSPGDREREREVERRRRREEEEERELQRARGGAPTGVEREEDGRHPHQEAGGRETGKYARKEIAAVAAAPERPPPKSLDDLFKKTKAKPSIYWLPLNKEQIAEKEALRRKLMAENEKQLAALKLKHEQERQEREKQRLEREKQREVEKEKEKTRDKERAAAAAVKRRSRSRSRKRLNKRSPRRSSRSRRSVSRSSSRRSRRRSRS